MDVDKFIEGLDDDLAWRKKELSDLLLFCSTSESEALTKSLLLMLYSHWEGFIKNAAKLYLLYVSGLNEKSLNLTLNFNTILLKGLIKECHKSSDSLTLENEMKFMDLFAETQASALFNIPSNITKEKNKDFINTHDNLTPDVFSNICRILGMAEKKCLVTKKKYFDETFINGRNAISHGSKILLDGQNEFDLDKQQLIKLKDVVLLIMSTFKDDLIEYATQKFYIQTNKQLKDSYDEGSNQQLASALQQLFPTT